MTAADRMYVRGMSLCSRRGFDLSRAAQPPSPFTPQLGEVV